MKYPSKKTILTALILAALAGAAITAARRIPNRETGKSKTAAAAVMPAFSHSAEESRKLRERFLAESSTELVKGLRKSFFKVSLSTPSKETDFALASLAGGLASEDEQVKGAAILLVQSLLIDVAHAQVQVDPANQEKISALFMLYKMRAQGQIAKMRAAFPNSPTLAYLEKI